MVTHGLFTCEFYEQTATYIQYTIEFFYKIAISLPNILYCYLINSDVTSHCQKAQPGWLPISQWN